MRQRRSFTPEFKAQVVLELISGSRTCAEICRQHQLSPHLLGNWKATFLERAAVLFEVDEHRSAEAARVADLERLVGRMALETEILKKASSILQQRRTNGGR
jgi:transposase-like protein